MTRDMLHGALMGGGMTSEQADRIAEAIIEVAGEAVAAKPVKPAKVAKKAKAKKKKKK